MQSKASRKSITLHRVEERTVAVALETTAQFGAPPEVKVVAERERYAVGLNEPAPDFTDVRFTRPELVLPAVGPHGVCYRMTIETWKLLRAAADEAIADYEAAYGSTP